MCLCLNVFGLLNLGVLLVGGILMQVVINLVNFGMQNLQVRSPSDVKWVKGGEFGSQYDIPLEEFDLSGLPDVLASDRDLSYEDVWFRDERFFVAGMAGRLEMRRNWELVLASNPRKEELLQLLDGVRVRNYLCHFKGTFDGEEFDSDFPVLPYAKKNARCCYSEEFKPFVEKTIRDGCESGAMRCWGQVGRVEPPLCVSPITIEPSKPRFCHDQRYFNLWMKPVDFSLPSIRSIPALGASFLMTFDLKAAYYNFQIHPDDVTYFGFEWDGFYYVYNVMPFGWSVSPCCLQSFTEAIMFFLLSFDIPGLVYLDDFAIAQMFSMMHGGELWAARRAGFVLCVVLNAVGLFVSIKKSSPKPEVSKVFLGFRVDCWKRTFAIEEGKAEKFVALVDECFLLNSRFLWKSLERFVGKCVHFSEVILGGMFFTRRFIKVIIAMRKNHLRWVNLTDELREDFLQWRTMVMARKEVAWLDPRHVSLSIHSDASGFRWFGKVVSSAVDVRNEIFGGDFDEEWAFLPIHIKEAYAVVQTFLLLSGELKDLRVDFWVDNSIVVNSFKKGGGRVPKINELFRQMALVANESNILLKLYWISTKENLADGGSREGVMNDCRLQQHRREELKEEFPSLEVDGMASDANSLFSVFYSRYMCPGSAGVNLLAQDYRIFLGKGLYIFPPGPLVVAVSDWICSISSVHGVCLLWAVNPFIFPRLMGRSRSWRLVAKKGDKSWITLFQHRRKKLGWFDYKCPHDLWLFVF